MPKQRFMPGDLVRLPTRRLAVCIGYRVESGKAIFRYSGVGGEVELDDRLPKLGPYDSLESVVTTDPTDA